MTKLPPKLSTEAKVCLSAHVFHLTETKITFLEMIVRDKEQPKYQFADRPNLERFSRTMTEATVSEVVGKGDRKLEKSIVYFFGSYEGKDRIFFLVPDDYLSKVTGRSIFKFPSLQGVSAQPVDVVEAHAIRAMHPSRTTVEMRNGFRETLDCK